MRIAAAFLVLLVMTSGADADPSARAAAVIEALQVDDATANKLLDIVIAHDKEQVRLERVRNENKRRLILAHQDKPKDIDLVLEDAVATERALAANEEQLIRRTRRILGAKRAAQLLVLMSATEPDRRDARTFVAPDETQRSSYDPDALFPPPAVCNPFASMHGCGR
jgi:hypothetical protein